MADSNNKKLVLGRAGELVDECDKETFELIRRIFAQYGPYRNVLSEFGIGLNTSEEFLVYKGKKIYSDIDKENSILWHTCLSALVVKDNKVRLVAHYKIPHILKGLLGFTKKILKETYYLTNISKAEKLADDKYSKYSELLKKSVEKSTIDIEEFLYNYEKVVFITYLYELFFNFNNNLETQDCLVEYVRENDFLLQYDEKISEIALVGNASFSLEDSEKTKKKISHTNISSLNYIPSYIPFPNCDVPRSIGFEKKLQCMKNNLRLKTNLLVRLL